MTKEYKYLSLSELCAYINLSKSTIYKKTSQREIPHIKSGKKLLFDQARIDQWLEQFEQPTCAEMESSTDILKSSKSKL